jgi:uncharacterized membrane-anchored protein
VTGLRLRARDIAVLGGLFAILAIVNWQIAAKERVLRAGDSLLLQLAPVDPRSLIQGDYMRLDYAIARDLGFRADWPRDGWIVVANDANGVARFVRIDDPSVPLGIGEHLLRYRRRSSRIRIGTDAFYFQEGQAERFSHAMYGEVRVDASGEALLVGLRDRERQPIAMTAPTAVSSPAAPAPSASSR